MRILVAGLLVLAATAQSVEARPKMESANFPSAQGRDITGYYFRPSGDGPFPAVIAMHGCGGLFDAGADTMSADRTDWAFRLVDAGYLVLWPDTNRPRGFDSVCDIRPDRLTIKLPDHAGDLAGATNWLLQQPFVDTTKIGLIGWGTGGTAVLRMLDPQLPLNQHVAFKAAIAIYPRCQPLLSMDYAPLLAPTILMGAADEWVPPAPCKALAARWRSPIVLYPGAYHNFDVPNVPVRKRQTGEGPKLAGTNPAARAKAIQEVMALFDKAFAPPPDTPSKSN